MSQLLQLLFAVALLAVASVNSFQNCYNWSGCLTWYNETRERCESVCERSDVIKNNMMDCTKPCLSNGFCVGIRRVKNDCLCESECMPLPPCPSYIYENCEQWGKDYDEIRTYFIRRILQMIHATVSRSTLGLLKTHQ
jgi:hypothetical protein